MWTNPEVTRKNMSVCDCDARREVIIKKVFLVGNF